MMWHNRAVLFSSMGFGRKVEKWDRLDRTLKTYAHMAVASWLSVREVIAAEHVVAVAVLVQVATVRVPRPRGDLVRCRTRRALQADSGVSQPVRG